MSLGISLKFTQYPHSDDVMQALANRSFADCVTLSNKPQTKMAQNLRCPECGYEAKDENDKREHMKRQHQNTGGGQTGQTGGAMNE